MGSKTRLVLFQLTLVIVLLLVVEIVLRCMGYAPGDMRPNWLNFHAVDTLKVISNFRVDSEGILVADPAYWTTGPIKVNEDGFRSPAFNKIDSSKKKVLFIGDSFTWGLSAEPLVDHCFVDLVRNETNYEVINLGIPATDPPQYSALVKKYMQRFKPDITFVMFYMGNDLLVEDRQLSPDNPIYYYTNAGAITADIDGIHFKSAQEVYHYAMYERYYLREPKNAVEWVVSKSALLSRVYSLKYRLREKRRYDAAVKDSHITKKYLKQMQQTARQNGMLLKFVLIPEIKDADMPINDYRQKYADIMLDSELKNDWLILPGNKKSNYNAYPDGHFNNAGHRFYADFIEAYLKTIGK